MFFSLAEVQVLIEAWRRHYNTVRPHSSLGYRPPAPDAVVPRGGSIVPWASAPALGGARSPNLDHGINKRHELTLNLDHR